MRDGGDLPRTVAPLPFVTEHNISSAGRANNGEVRKRDSGDPPPPFREDQISSPRQGPRAAADLLVRIVSFIKHCALLSAAF